MRYTYTTMSQNSLQEVPVRKDVTTRFEEITVEHVTPPLFVVVSDNTTNTDTCVLRTQDDYHEWWETLARASTWMSKEDRNKRAVLEPVQLDLPLEEPTFNHVLPDETAQESLDELVTGKLIKPIKDHINPDYYQGYVMDLQWLETMQYLPHFRDPDCFLAAVELQVRKYIDRTGGKNEELQETKKAIWYLKFMAAYMANGRKPIRVADIKTLLGE